MEDVRASCSSALNKSEWDPGWLDLHSAVASALLSLMSLFLDRLTTRRFKSSAPTLWALHSNEGPSVVHPPSQCAWLPLLPHACTVCTCFKVPSPPSGNLTVSPLPPAYGLWGCLTCWHQIHLPKALFWWCRASLKTFDGFSLGKTNSLVSNDVSAAFPHDRDSPDSKQLLLLPVSLPMSMDFISPNSEAGLRYFRGPCRPYEWRENDKWYPTLGLNLGEEKKAICGLWRNIQHTFHTREQPLLRPN